jgi:hypothetical protein
VGGGAGEPLALLLRALRRPLQGPAEGRRVDTICRRRRVRVVLFSFVLSCLSFSFGSRQLCKETFFPPICKW